MDSKDQPTSPAQLSSLMEKSLDLQNAEKKEQVPQNEGAVATDEKPRTSRTAGLKHPLEHFSKEQWEGVLQYLVEPKDVINASNACPLFRTILEEKQSQEMLKLSRATQSADQNFQNSLSFIFGDI